MNKICTSLEQSQKLIELGIDIKTADMYYSFDYNIEEYDEDAQIIPKSELGQHFSLFPEDVAAWSLTALLELLPYEIVLDEDESLIIGIYKEDLQYYINYDNTYNGEVNYETSLYDNLVDACYEMIIRLNELKML